MKSTEMFLYVPQAAHPPPFAHLPSQKTFTSNTPRPPSMPPAPPPHFPHLRHVLVECRACPLGLSWGQKIWRTSRSCLPEETLESRKLLHGQMYLPECLCCLNRSRSASSLALRRAVLCCAVLCCAGLGWAVLRCAVLCSAVLCCAVLRCAALC